MLKPSVEKGCSLFVYILEKYYAVLIVSSNFGYMNLYLQYQK